MISSLLYNFNHAPLWRRELGVWNRRMRAASLDRLVFLGLHRLGWMGQEEALLLRQLVRPGMQVVDVGANVGLYSLLLAQLTGKSGRVYSFEPEPNLFATFAGNCATNLADNVVPFQCALGASKGRSAFRRSSLNSGNNSLGENSAGADCVEVEVARLDDVLPVRTVDLIKLDVQGHELAALKGMTDVLASSPNVLLLFEFWPAGLRAAGTTPEELLTFLGERGFLIQETEAEVPRDLQDAGRLIRELGRNGYTNLLASRKESEENV